MDIPAVIDYVIVQTSRGKSKSDYLKSFTELIDVNLNSFSDILTQIHQVKQKLESTGCFKAVKVTIDTSELYENHSQHGHQIIFDLDEKLLNLSTHTGVDIDKANPDGSINLSLPNVFGRGEMLSLKLGREFRKYEKSRGVLPNIQADFLKTFLDQKTSLSAQLKHDYAEKEWSNVCEEQMVAASTLAYAFSPNFTLKSTVSSRLANILGLSSRDIPLCLREQFGYAKKNSLIFEAQYDTTGNYKYNVVPTFGTKVRMSQEVWSDSMRSQIESAFYYTLFNSVTAKFAGQCGMVKSKHDLHYCDKFFLGGINSLRGFRQNSIGPKESECALGGQTFWKTGCHLYSRLDFLSSVTGGLLANSISPAIGFHAFAEAGNVGSIDQVQDIAKINASFGVGIALGLAPGVNFELNTCRLARGDASNFKTGLNAGFSISI